MMISQVQNRFCFNVVSAALLAISLLLYGCSKPVNGEEKEDDAESAAAIPVEAVKVTTRDMAAFYSGTTTLEADKRAHYAAHPEPHHRGTYHRKTRSVARRGRKPTLQALHFEPLDQRSIRKLLTLIAQPLY